METQLNSFLFMFLSLIFLVPSAIIMYSIGYRIGRKKSNKEINIELDKMTDKVNCTLEKYSNKTKKEKELSDLNNEAENIKNYIEKCKKQLILDDISISFQLKAKKELEKKIDIEKCKLTLINTEIEISKKQ